MTNYLDEFAAEVRRKRKLLNLTQQQLATKLNMSTRTIIALENNYSNPKGETIFLIARELNISLDSIVFSNMTTEHISKLVIDFFSGKSDAEIQKYIALCQQAEQLKAQR
ncbi:XRE family transcriptional regulator [Hydrogeniiclostridium mannosilyticum]|uniref:XRE family transcriptional regulator n=1 Tax=Hydrogeniiclostridium mannosilyticum TaxID=2764322 RepID=A0A328UDY2_9FIRM|nr:helix-turn-helix transcriptional regulator [Hydrogeniiclostridium mannosilyticum]RAQ30077.1 XRE family transcriptional regulator [Hydrogeniiclostridium mannosilyticum]